MKKLSVLSIVLCLVATTDQVRADDDLDIAVSILASTVGSIRVRAENCNVKVDPMLEARVAETLALTPGFSVSDLISLFDQQKRRAASLRGSVCYPEDAEGLKTSLSIYERSIDDLRKQVTDKYGN